MKTEAISGKFALISKKIPFHGRYYRNIFPFIVSTPTANRKSQTCESSTKKDQPQIKRPAIGNMRFIFIYAGWLPIVRDAVKAPEHQ